MHRPLLANGDTNAKLYKSNNRQTKYLTAGLSLAPHDSSGFQVCPLASLGCKLSCLYFAGRGAMSNVKWGRIRKTQRFHNNRKAFMLDLYTDLNYFVRKADKAGRKLAVRLNVLSDIPWESIAPELFAIYAQVQWYDYTKIPKRLGKVPSNYHLTFSRSETNVADSVAALEAGHNVAVVFEKVPKRFWGRKVIDGDYTDLRFLDPQGVIVGLKAKGRAKKDTTGFVVRPLDALLEEHKPPLTQG